MTSKQREFALDDTSQIALSLFGIFAPSGAEAGPRLIGLPFGILRKTTQIGFFVSVALRCFGLHRRTRYAATSARVKMQSIEIRWHSKMTNFFHIILRT